LQRYGSQIAAGITLLLCCLPVRAQDLLTVSGIPGRPGGTLVYASRTELKSLNPVMAADSASREVWKRMNADLIHINRGTQKTEPALAKSWAVTPDGLHYTLELRRGLQFSDGKPFDADDVVFSFQLYLDAKLDAPARDLLIVDGKPIGVVKLDAYRVRFDLPRPYAAAERLFDGFVILPRHLLEGPYRAGKLAESWTLRTPPAEIAGLGPFRFAQYVPGQRIVLERNPYYWKRDTAGHRLPYLDRMEVDFAGSEDMQAMRFESGDSDILNRVGAKNFAALEKDADRRGNVLNDEGPGLEYSFLFFNLDDAAEPIFQRAAFRRAVSMAIDRAAIVRLVYLGHATPLATPVPPGSKAWVDHDIPPPAHSVEKARELLKSQGFSWAGDGGLLEPGGKRVEFTIVTTSGNNDRVEMATLIQNDLKPLGMNVHVAPLEFRSLLDRVMRTHDYEACLLSLASGDADPTPDMGVWLSSSANHLWHPAEKTPATPWEAEIDRLMNRQMFTPRYADRKQLYDRVQELLSENLPLIPLVAPDILVGAKKNLGNFRPALLDHYTLWNADELYWRGNSGGIGK